MEFINGNMNKLTTSNTFGQCDYILNRGKEDRLLDQHYMICIIDINIIRLPQKSTIYQSTSIDIHIILWAIKWLQL